ncbi:hypothetical protein Tco_0209765 [Tanacetum coccineum]
MPKRPIMEITCSVMREEYIDFLNRFIIPSCYSLVLPGSYQTAIDVPSGCSVLYFSLFTAGNFRLPLNKFFLDVLDFFQCYISLLNPYGSFRLSSFAVACKAYGGEPTLPLFRSLLTLSLAGDWLTFQNAQGVGTFSFPYPSEPLDVSLRARLTRFPIEPYVFPDAILYLADLAPLWEGHLCIQLFLLMVEYHGNHHISVAVVPFNVSVSGRNSADLTVEASEGDMGVHLSSHGTASVVPPISLSSKGKSVIGSSSCGLKRGWFGSSGSGSAGFIGPLATSEENSDSYSFLPGDEAVHEACDVLSKLDHQEVLKLRETVFMLKGEQSISSATIARLEVKLLSIRGGSSVIDSVTVHDLMSENEKLKKDIASPQELS